MWAFIFSMLLGVAQMFLLKFTLEAITIGQRKTAFKFLAGKFLLYIVAIGLLIFKFLDINTLIRCVCGFAVGMPLTAVGFFIYGAFFKEN